MVRRWERSYESLGARRREINEDNLLSPSLSNSLRAVKSLVFCWGTEEERNSRLHS